MLIYYIYIFVFCIGSFFEKYDAKVGKRIFNVLIIAIIIFLGIRYKVGNDYMAYYNNYRGINFGNYLVSAEEPLYVLANRLLSFEIFIFVFGFLSIWLLRKFIVQFAEPGFLVITLLVYYCLYFVIFNVHLIRQGLAISIVLYSYIYLFKKDYRMYLLLVVVAFLIHTSAIFVVPFGFLFHKELKIKLQVILLAAGLGIALNPVFFGNIFYSIAGSIPVLNKYLDFYRIEEVTNYGVSTGIIMDICLVVFFMFNLKKLNPKERFLYNIFFISVIFSLLLIINPGALRLNYYFRTTNIFLLPLIYKHFKIKLIPFLIVIGISIIYLINSFSTMGEYGRGDRNLPYKTLFDKE